MPDLLDSILFTKNEDWQAHYWCKPTNFEDFVTNPYHLKQKGFSEKQYEAIFALIGKDPLNVFSSTRIKHVGVFLWGKGSGKDYVTSILQAYILYLLLCMKDPHAYFDFPVAEPLDSLNVAPTAQQARKIFFTKFTSRIRNWKWLTDNFRVIDKGKPLRNSVGERLEIRITDTSVETSHNIRFSSLHSEAGNFEGYNVLFFCGDEIAEFDDKFETVIDGDEIINVGKADIIYNTLVTSAASRNLPWLGVLISFPRRTDDFIMRKYKEYEDTKDQEDCMLVGRRGCTWDFNPIYKGMPTFRFEEWDVPIKLRKQFETDPADSRMKFCTVPPITLNRFFYNDERIQAAVDLNILPLVDVTSQVEEIFDGQGKKVKYAIKKITGSRLIDKNKAYAIHVDLSVSGDSTTVVIGHGEPCDMKSTFITEDGKQELKTLQTRVVIDQIITWEPQIKQHIVVSHVNVDEVIEQLIALTGCQYVSYDQYQSQYVLEKLIREGINSEKHNIRDKDYYLMRNMLWAGGISYPNHEKFLFEIRRLIYDGKRVDHLPIYSKDICDSVCGVVRAIATGLAKAQTTMIYSFMDERIFGDFAAEDLKPLIPLPKDALPNTIELLKNPEDPDNQRPGSSFTWFL